MEAIFTTIHYYLVDHPTISKYEWKPNQTPGASPQFLTATVLTYLLLTLTLHRTQLLPPLNPTLLRQISAAHSLTLLLLSLTMAVGCSLSALSQMPDPTWLFCFPAAASNQTPPRGPVFFWAHVFYFSKLLEFVDTLLIILSSGSGSKRRLSFLHVYHHAVVVVMCYVWLATSQSLMPVALVTNACVHVLMYGYYMMCACGVRPRWKRAVTDCQIVQFVFSFGVSGVMLYYHFTSTGVRGAGGCSGIWGWCFNAGFNASLLALFLDFHSKNYDAQRRRKKIDDNHDEDKRS